MTQGIGFVYENNDLVVLSVSWLIYIVWILYAVTSTCDNWAALITFCVCSSPSLSICLTHTPYLFPLLPNGKRMLVVGHLYPLSFPLVHLYTNAHYIFMVREWEIKREMDTQHTDIYIYMQKEDVFSQYYPFRIKSLSLPLVHFSSRLIHFIFSRLLASSLFDLDSIFLIFFYLIWLYEYFNVRLLLFPPGLAPLSTFISL